MFINYIKNNIQTSNDDFAEHNAKETIVYDPHGSPYYFKYLKKEKDFEIISAGED